MNRKLKQHSGHKRTALDSLPLDAAIKRLKVAPRMSQDKRRSTEERGVELYNNTNYIRGQQTVKKRKPEKYDSSFLAMPR